MPGTPGAPPGSDRQKLIANGTGSEGADGVENDALLSQTDPLDPPPGSATRVVLYLKQRGKALSSGKVIGTFLPLVVAMLLTLAAVIMSGQELVIVNSNYASYAVSKTALHAEVGLTLEFDARLRGVDPQADLVYQLDSNIAAMLKDSHLRDVPGIASLPARLGEVRSAFFLASNRSLMINMYRDIATIVETAAHKALGEAVVGAEGSLLAALCFASELYVYSQQFFYLAPSMARQWSSSVFRDYQAVKSELPDRCARFLPSAQPAMALVRNLHPTSQNLPADPPRMTFGFAEVQRTPSRAQLLSTLFQEMEQSATREWGEDKDQALLALAFSVAALCVIVVLVVIVFIAAEHTTTLHMDDARSRLRSLEQSTKFIHRYVQILQLCNIHDTDHHFIKSNASSFLNSVVDFVSKIRPFVPQSAFGDVENVPLTGMNTTRQAMRQLDISSEDQAIRELHLRDLRSDMGMQVVSGTIMCLSLYPFNRTIDMELGNPSSEELLATTVHHRFSAFLAVAERIINGATGVIHALVGDQLVALWNVTSSTSTPQVNAVRCALMLLKKSGDSAQLLSIGIAQSFLLAGNLEAGKRKGLAICGPAIVLAEHLEAANSAHRTNIMVSATVAEAVVSTVFADLDFSVRPVALVRCKIRGEPEDLHHGYAVLPQRLKQEKLKAWQTVFKEMSTKVATGHYNEALKAVEDYRTQHLTLDANKVGASGKVAKAPAVDRTVEFYRRFLAQLQHQESSKNGANQNIGF